MVLHPDTSNSRELFLTLNQKDTERLDIEKVHPTFTSSAVFSFGQNQQEAKGKGNC